jgi:glucose-6-phosphate isomerase
LGVMREKWGNELERLVVIADANSVYTVAARGKGVSTLTLPTLVGGRFSVLSAVGLFPLALLGLPIGELHAGALGARQFCVAKEVLLNPAAQSALVLATEYAKGKNVHDTFVFGNGLEFLGKWYRQLLGESIGKETASGMAVGITPTVSVGSTDLHSVGQLYLGGPNARVTTFVSVQAQTQSPHVPTSGRIFPELSPVITGKSTTEIMDAILSGTTHAYNERGLPFMKIELEGVNLSELGAFMQMKMIEVMCLAFLLKVNAFNQPAVELYKTETKRILEQEPKAEQ